MALRDVLSRIAKEIPWDQADLDSLSEDDVIRELIEPILAELGWNGVSRLRRERSVEVHRQMRMDYALLGADGKPLAVIEAKRPREILAKHTDQVLKYAELEDVEICALTNGVYWWLYLTRGPGDFEERRFASLDMTRPFPALEAAVLEETLGYEALISGAAAESARKRLEERKRNEDERKRNERRMAEIPRAWHRLVNDSGTNLFDLVGEEVFQAIGQRPEPREIRETLRRSPDVAESFLAKRAPVTLREISFAVNETCYSTYKSSVHDNRIAQQLARDLVVYL
ncbi:MAG: type I restriction endonuclease, partial [Chloroflexi bacterium]|nr:type I restriction endonuclease [Chloroflexota bacterium]